MDDKDTTISQLRDLIEEFIQERDWKKTHNPKDLTIGLDIEVSEILEHFRFRTNEDIEELLKNPDVKKEISHEVADVAYFLFALVNVLDIDLTKAYLEKMEISRKRYPKDLVKGQTHKYTHYQ